MDDAGDMLALGLNGHDLFLANCSTGKVVTKIDCSQIASSKICCLGWGVNLTNCHAMRLRLETPKATMTLDDVINRNPRLQAAATAADLPLHLAFMNVEGSLPKLCPINLGEMR